MRTTVVALLVIGCLGTAAGMWQAGGSGTSAELRGISAVVPEVVWAAGRNGTWARTADGGRTWAADVVPGAAGLFFIDVHAVDANTAYLLGTHFDGGLATIFKTTDGGAIWQEQFSDRRDGVFFDGMAFWNAETGVAFGDPVDGSFVIVRTADGGAQWDRIPMENIPTPLPGEAGFAASGTALAVWGDDHVWFGTGGGEVARVFRSDDRGRTWTVSATPLTGNPTSGIFGIAFRDESNGVAVGGDYSRPRDAAPNVLRTNDGGRSWSLIGSSRPPGVRYGVAYVRVESRAVLVAVGPSGLGYSLDDGSTWTAIDTVGYNTVTPAAYGLAWVAGIEGRVARLDLTDY